MAAPLVAVTGPERGAFGPRFLVAQVLRLYGARPIQVRPSDIDALPDFEAVVVTGGHDVQPVLYGAEPEVHPKYDPDRDELEKRVIHKALAEHRPLLGICRGAQLLNVCLGGTLVQDLRLHRRKTSHRRTILPLKTLEVVPETLLLNLLGKHSQRINSLHNQAIDRLGRGLHVSGRDHDGIVQAVEDPSYGFLLGVQWHPEFLLYRRSQRHLFHALIASIKKPALG
ncbi:gamma-glutamyl-gamma-aminobutyrate hydrolase family protein [Marinimicrobium sp. C6131]|uniref:gamma-glutamyl-gamma-aminobutyrate hydrolase family protein n=1 Tax=Marinimicrobium sp. C6131 TaxID=3022676 RepID=UPI00223DEFDB|nr:gamma-glutamyl-gamma-aminobutyrate hydrolase family protein [Marinimicrobium sp. C6131]UZJ44300.1 gamma-glutamyl-gamma-aminobutyrate hydrolase family protein [Marinimicrobium sp. C6131]